MAVSSVSREGGSLDRLTADTAEEVSRVMPNETGDRSNWLASGPLRNGNP